MKINLLILFCFSVMAYIYIKTVDSCTNEVKQIFSGSMEVLHQQDMRLDRIEEGVSHIPELQAEIEQIRLLLEKRGIK